MITVVSQHLHLLNERFVPREQILRNIHYIETIRYKTSSLNKLREAEVEVPVGFDPGMKIPEHELSHYYRFMVIWFEIESIIRTGRSFIDFFWRTVVNYSPELGAINEVKNQKYMSSALRELRKPDYDLDECQTYQILEKEWSEWGCYLLNFRNYIEYTEPLGGMLSASVGILIQKGNTIDILLPDSFPDHYDNPKEYNFEYSSSITANFFFNKLINHIDSVFPSIINEMNRKILEVIDTKK